MKKMPMLLLAIVAFLVVASASAQVLGPCGAPQPAGQEGIAANPPGHREAPELAISPVPLPGQRAIDFDLTAVVGDEIKNVKLSDYQGKWRVVCFFPAAFTFV